MRKLLGIIEDDTAPSTSYMWLDKGELKYFRNGKWVPLSSGNSGEINEQLNTILNTPV